MTTEHSYDALLIGYGHDPATLKQTVSILNDPLPEHVLMGQELFQAMYQAGIPWAWLSPYANPANEDEHDPRVETIDPDEVAENPQDWFVHFDVTGLEATYQVLGIQTYEPYAVLLELVRWSTK